MNKFTFSLPNGQTFELTGPADATVAQAERIFLEQLAAGSFVGLRPGDTLQAPGAEVFKFNLSRLDRGTAGVANLPLLAIYPGGIISALPLLSDIPVDGGIDLGDYLGTTTVTTPIGPLSPPEVQAIVSQVETIVDQDPDTVTEDKGVGKYGFNIPQLEKLGLVKPGTGCRFAGLQPTPYVESQPNPPNFLEVLGSPAIWTGRDGVRSLNDILANEELQDRLQFRLVNDSYNELVETGQIQTQQTDPVYPVGSVYQSPTGSNSNSGLISIAGVGSLALAALSRGGLSTLSLANIGTGISSAFSSASTSLSNLTQQVNLSGLGISDLSLTNITGSISGLADRGVAQLGGLLTNASKFGVGTATSWAKGLTPDALTSQLNSTGKLGQFSINFSDFKIPNLVSGVSPAAAYEGTINRATVDSTTNKLIGTSRIQTPNFSPAAPIPLGFNSLQSAMTTASSLLRGGSTNILNQTVSVAGAVTSAARRVG